jgi:hypothetical protein
MDRSRRGSRPSNNVLAFRIPARAEDPPQLPPAKGGKVIAFSRLTPYQREVARDIVDLMKRGRHLLRPPAAITEHPGVTCLRCAEFSTCITSCEPVLEAMHARAGETEA